jgi:hypothetical protein
MRSGEVPFAFELGGGEELQPSPDSRNIDDLTGSLGLALGECELEVSRRSRKGVSGRGLGVLIVRDGDDEYIFSLSSSSA